MSEGCADMESRHRVWKHHVANHTGNRCGIPGMCDVWITFTHAPMMYHHVWNVVVIGYSYTRTSNVPQFGVVQCEWVQRSHADWDRWTTKTSSACDMMCVARVTGGN